MGDKKKFEDLLDVTKKKFFRIICFGISGVCTSFSIFTILKWVTIYQTKPKIERGHYPYDKISLMATFILLLSLIVIQYGISKGMETKVLISKVNWLGLVAFFPGLIFFVLVAQSKEYSIFYWIPLSVSIFFLWFIVIVNVYCAIVFLFYKFKELESTEKLNIIIPVITLIIGAMLGNR